mgnify:CR=1 FL=1
MFNVYTKENCPQCDEAKRLLTQSGKAFRTLKLGEDISRDELLALIPSARTMPQIMLGEQVICGVQELKRLLSAAQ